MDLAIYIPADNTSAAIRIAIARAQQDALGFDARTISAKTSRDGLLLADDPAGLKKAEAHLAEARNDGERLEAIGQHLQVRLTSTLRQEKIDGVEAAKETLSAANDALNGFVTEHGPALAGLLAAAHTAWERQATASAIHQRVQRSAIAEFVDADDVEAAERVSQAGSSVTAVAPEAEMLTMLISRSPFVPDFAAAFPAVEEADKRGAARLWPRRAAR